MIARTKRLGRLAAAALVTPGVVALGAWAFMAAASRHDVHPSAEAAPPRAVAIVLGAKVWADGAPSQVLEDRLRCAEDAYRRGRVHAILVTGDHGAPEYDETSAMKDWLVARGVPRADVIADHAGFRTLDSMHRANAVFGVSDAIVCTQAFHLPRALFLARSFGIDAVGVIADRRVYRGAAWNGVREAVARPIAMVEVLLLGRGARFLGPPV